ncbi:unnamed protein product [Trichobilharzia szidati]|nr:unnamed protein product [Trichobilharzia szidati]
MSIIYLFSFILLAFSYSTVNSLVPKPTTYKEGERTCRLNEDLPIEHAYSYCLILNDAVEEFSKRLVKTSQHLHNKETSCSIDKMTISITDECDESYGDLWPSEKMKESYKIVISDEKIEITSTEVWGTLHALQTVLQLAHRNAFGTLVINESTIEDSPQFTHRGFVVNTAAHFISVDVLENFLKWGPITPVVWEDAFENGYRPTKQNPVFQVWKDSQRQERVKNITSAGYRVILSSCFRIFANNYVEHWYPYYECDPRDFSESEQEKQLVIGGEAFVVGDFVDDTILFTRSWPEGAVVAERLWSQGEFKIEEFIPRLTELRCRMLDFGLNAKPLNEPKSCLQL